MNLIRCLRFTAPLSYFICQTISQAAPIPVRPLEALEPAWEKVSLRVDVRNLIATEAAAKIPEAKLSQRLEEVNLLWSQCSIRFVVRKAENVAAAKVGAPYPPKNEGDLSTIAGALNPHGFDGAIPVTVAGPWNYFDAGTGLFPHGLGWVFTNGNGKVDRIGAMVAAQKLDHETAALVIGHELGHALSLPHVSDPNNLMLGGPSLMREQCVQARRFIEIALQEFQVADRKIPSSREG